ncbi:hypothetical protein MN869_09500 [Acinetobacter sp. NIPH1876]|uniref:hypothetical protein n=1 Tax=Acinetobacter sp. NIPH1876 TaxID=2924041 RepID=UPI001FAE1666|nr:hypothetical protein [Acinetobacter sp. NIPH1876]MCJ0828681.1 hypothetical protein [Acinetobacter sp. NIPH1876]
MSKMTSRMTFFDILSFLIQVKVMEYAKIEGLYDQFVNHEGYAKLSDLASSSYGNGNIGMIMMFLTTKFKSKNKKIFFHHDFKILVDDKLVSLDLNKAPEFKDQDRFLAWLHEQIFNQT